MDGEVKGSAMHYEIVCTVAYGILTSKLKRFYKWMSLNLKWTM